MLQSSLNSLAARFIQQQSRRRRRHAIALCAHRPLTKRSSIVSCSGLPAKVSVMAVHFQRRGGSLQHVGGPSSLTFRSLLHAFLPRIHESMKKGESAQTEKLVEDIAT